MTKLLTLTALLSALAIGVANAADGQALYDKECSKCHGKDGKGQTTMGKKMGARDYTDAKVQESFTDEAAFKATKEGFKDKEGKTLMKPHDNLTDDEIKAIVKYMRTFKGK